MAKAHYFQYLCNEEGQPVNAADISVYLAGTSTGAYVFSSETGATALNTTPQTTTNSEGFFEFWIGDNTELNGYSGGQKFKLVWSKPGIISDGEIDNIDIDIVTNKAGVYTEGVESASWTPSDGQYYINITHNLNKPYPMVISYDDVTSSSVPVTAAYINNNVTKVWKSTNLKGYITVVG